jgi:hypothetical protein
MRASDLSHAKWDQPDDRDHPVLMWIMIAFAIAMFSLVCIYG